MPCVLAPGLAAIRGAKVDPQRQDPIIQRPLGVPDHGEVHEVALGLLGEASTLGAFDGRESPTSHCRGPLPKTLYHGLNVKLLGHRARP